MRTRVPPSKLPYATGRGEGAFAPYLKAVRHHPIVVAAAVLVTLAASVTWLAQRTPTYEATAQILVTPIAGDAAASGLPLLTDSVDPTRTIQTASTILDSPRAAVTASQELGAEWSPGRLMGAVDIEAQGDSNIIAVTAEAASGGEAADAANVYARAVLNARSATLGEQVDVQIASLQARYEELRDADPASAAALAGDIAVLESIGEGRDPNFSLLQEASVPDAATGVAAGIVVVLALLAGATIGVGTALVMEQLDQRLRDEEALLETYPLPVLARVPALRRTVGDHLDAGSPLPEVTEALRTLRVQIESPGHDNRVVVFTSASPGDGKTTAAIDFAIALADADVRVVVLDLDLRKPDIGARLNVSSDMRTMFRRDLDLADLLVPAPANPRVQILSTRPTQDISRVLETLTRRLPELIEQARDLADYVVIDTAPLGRVSDALRIASAADEVVLVARPGNTMRNELVTARDMLGRFGVAPAGMVIVGASRATTGAYYAYAADHRRSVAHLTSADSAARPQQRAGSRGSRRASDAI